MLSAYLLALISGMKGPRCPTAQADQLRRAAGQHQLVGASAGDLPFGPARGAQQAQHDGEPGADRQHRLDPGGEVAVAERGVAVEPVVIGRQVEFADAAGNRGAVLDGHQPVVLAQVLADLALHGEQRRRGLFDFVERAGERLFGNVGIVAEGKQDLALALEFLHQVELEIGAAGDFENLEQRHQRDMMLLARLRRR